MKDKEYGLKEIIVLVIILTLMTIVSVNYFNNLRKELLADTYVSIETDSAIL